MGFLAPWFLGGLAALGVPVFVHLLRRHVTTPRPVGSIRCSTASRIASMISSGSRVRDRTRPLAT